MKQINNPFKQFTLNYLKMLYNEEFLKQNTRTLYYNGLDYPLLHLYNQQKHDLLIFALFFIFYQFNKSYEFGMLLLHNLKNNTIQNYLNNSTYKHPNELIHQVATQITQMSEKDEYIAKNKLSIKANIFKTLVTDEIKNEFELKRNDSHCYNTLIYVMKKDIADNIKKYIKSLSNHS